MKRFFKNWTDTDKRVAFILAIPVAITIVSLFRVVPVMMLFVIPMIATPIAFAVVKNAEFNAATIFGKAMIIASSPMILFMLAAHQGPERGAILATFGAVLSIGVLLCWPDKTERRDESIAHARRNGFGVIASMAAAMLLSINMGTPYELLGGAALGGLLFYVLLHTFYAAIIALKPRKRLRHCWVAHRD